MYRVIMHVLQEQMDYKEASRSNEKLKIDIQHIFKAMTTKTFWEEVPPVMVFSFKNLMFFPQYLNQRFTKGNISIVKVALILYTRIPPLLSIADIRNSVVIFTLTEYEAMGSGMNGLPLTHYAINDLLWVFYRFLQFSHFYRFLQFSHFYRFLQFSHFYRFLQISHKS